MTLNEKFDKATDGWIVADRCEEIADEFTIGFTGWFVCHYTEEAFYDKKYIKQMLEKYKKEKGL